MRPPKLVVTSIVLGPSGSLLLMIWRLACSLYFRLGPNASPQSTIVPSEKWGLKITNHRFDGRGSIVQWVDMLAPRPASLGVCSATLRTEYYGGKVKVKYSVLRRQTLPMTCSLDSNKELESLLLDTEKIKSRYRLGL